MRARGDARPRDQGTGSDLAAPTLSLDWQDPSQSQQVPAVVGLS